MDRRAVAGGIAVAGVYTLAILLEHHGVRSAAHGADVSLYETDARAIAHGSLPYRDLYFEYPPGALPPILAPEPASAYATAFKALMAVLGVGCLVGAAVVLRAEGRRMLVPLLAIAVAPVAVGSVFVNRFDLWPALLAVIAVALLVRGRPTAAFVFLALGATAQVWPAAAIPAAAVWVFRRYGSTALRRALTAFVATGLVVLLPFAAVGPGGLRFSFTIQLTRHLQTESLGGAILLAADRLGIYHATIATGKPGSLDLFGTLPTAVGALSLVAVVALIAWGAWMNTDSIVVAVAAAVAVYVAFGKVLSPQYLVWLVPLVPLARRHVATALLLVALVLTQIEFDHRYHELHTAGPVVWILLARDLCLVAVAAVLVSACRPATASRRTP
ncbi:MAG TPA: glycosyltransferase 87 family protein [Gaiellaceae bacterium]